MASENDVKVLARKNEKRDFEINFIPDSGIKAPILKGDVLGRIEVYEKGVLVGCANAIAMADVPLKTYFDALSDAVSKWSIVA